MRKLVTIQKIKDLQPIEGADAIEVATIKGWKVVVKKNEFKIGDLVVYFEIDSLLPPHPAYDGFLAPRGTKKTLHEGKEVEGYRLKTIRLRGQISQGLALRVSDFADKLKAQADLEEGADVSDLLGVVKYEPQIPVQLAGVARGFFPSFIPKTDEERVQNCYEDVINFVKNDHVTFYVTEKIDGTSCTAFYKDDELHVCSRNVDLQQTEDSIYWKIAKEYNFEEALKGTGCAIQGEIFGEGIQGNPLKMNGQHFRVFSIYNFEKQEYLNYFQMIGFVMACNTKRNSKIDLVPVIYSNEFLDYTSQEDLVRWSNRKSAINPKCDAEGIVIRSEAEYFIDNLGRLSFKSINPEYLLKHE